MALRVQTKINDTPDERGGIPAHIVAEQIVSQKQVASSPQYLLRCCHCVSRVHDIKERIRPTSTKVSPRHRFDSGGSYDVRLTVTTFDGSAVTANVVT